MARKYVSEAGEIEVLFGDKIFVKSIICNTCSYMY